MNKKIQKLSMALMNNPPSKPLRKAPIKIHTTTSVLCYDMSKQSLKELINKMLSLKIK